ncbi:hypothetical protein RB614_43260 [Phytohabitans sp. ZYX-F-186]|uniref:Uncharacterized protein n=1 Tax=Phytohabitans maris TaxID=3071409 RepID=A0ABU0ZYS2_9ACTN|nr:hypothetical protein [Phytohabitans sp. ZYX-F-186]MDQ7911330.1 hypothetical protein [Phytohabitans sp. ZYX-F-186]
MASFGRARLAIAGMVGLLLVGVAVPAPARAVAPAGQRSSGGPPTPAGEEALPPPQCPTGAITGYVVGTDSNGDETRLITGWIQHCAEAGRGFVVIQYFPGLGLGRTYLGRAESPAAFQVPALDGAGGALGPLTVACLSFTVTSRLACVEVDPGGPGQPPGVAPIPTDDPRVLVRVSQMPPETTDPTCGTCV